MRKRPLLVISAGLASLGLVATLAMNPANAVTASSSAGVKASSSASGTASASTTPVDVGARTIQHTDNGGYSNLRDFPNTTTGAVIGQVRNDEKFVVVCQTGDGSPVTANGTNPGGSTWAYSGNIWDLGVDETTKQLGYVSDAFVYTTNDKKQTGRDQTNFADCGRFANLFTVPVPKAFPAAS